MTILQRVQAPTPKFFKKIRNVGALAGGIGAAIFATPNLPPFLASIAGCLSAAGFAASLVSQATTNGDAQPVKEKDDGK